MASLLAAGVGIDLTVASIVIHYEVEPSQRKSGNRPRPPDRAKPRRPGVQIGDEHTIEEHIHEMIERKKGQLEDIIGVEDQISYLKSRRALKSL